MSSEVELPDIGTEVLLESGRRGIVYRHEYDLEGLADDEVHIMTLTEDDEFDEVLTCLVDELSYIDE
jgi:hypothetical protein